MRATGVRPATISRAPVWALIAAFMVFFMNLGFAMVESGLCRAKNCVNILAMTSAEEEKLGLDLGEHSQEAYPDFL